MPLATALFDYALPPHLIAQTPAERRDRSRLLVVNRSDRAIGHHAFADLPIFLQSGDTLFRNNASVLPARLRFSRPTGGQVECLLLAAIGGAANGEVWRCLVKPGRRLPAGASFAHPDGSLTAEIVVREDDGVTLVRFATRDGESVAAAANRLGDIPLPPYIERRGSNRREFDRERYQTVYADPARQVAAAAPTAGLHFTPELLAVLAAKGIRTADLTLHVGLGTFRPIATETIEKHPIHREVYEMPVATQRALFAEEGPLTGSIEGPSAGSEKGSSIGSIDSPSAGSGRPRRVAVGTTTVRSIEDFLEAHSAPLHRPHVAEAAIYLYPPREFRGVDALITNFHQPRSTLLCLVAAFLTPGSTDGIAWLKEIYAEAIDREYRFFSYGDAMLIL
jgi:S-adenosylmethionine:tRNA ribosyltransferase-isomerase